MAKIGASALDLGGSIYGIYNESMRWIPVQASGKSPFAQGVKVDFQRRTNTVRFTIGTKVQPWALNDYIGNKSGKFAWDSSRFADFAVGTNITFIQDRLALVANLGYDIKTAPVKGRPRYAAKSNNGEWLNLEERFSISGGEVKFGRPGADAKPVSAAVQREESYAVELPPPEEEEEGGYEDDQGYYNGQDGGDDQGHDHSEHYGGGDQGDDHNEHYGGHDHNEHYGGGNQADEVDHYEQDEEGEQRRMVYPVDYVPDRQDEGYGHGRGGYDY